MPAITSPSQTDRSVAAGATPIPLRSETRAKQFVARFAANVKWVRQFLHRGR